MSRRAVSASSWLTDTEERPRPGALSGARIRRRARVFRVYLWAAAGLCPLLLLALLAVFTAPAAPAPPGRSDEVSPGRAAATGRVLDWLAGPDPGLPGGRLLMFTGAHPVDTPTTDDTTGDPAVSVEVDAFVVVDDRGNTFTAAVQVAVDGHGRAAVLSGPSLTPLPQPDQDLTRNAGPWPGRASVQPTAPVTAAVRVWATAFTSGDPAALRLSVGDPDPGRGYLPLTGVARARTTVGSATVLDAATVVVRVELAVTWAPTGTGQTAAAPAVPAAGNPAAGTPRRVIGFDVLVTGADGAAPRVVAWGGPGTGPELTPFQNAVPTDPAHAPDTPVTVFPTFVPSTTSYGPPG